MEFARDPPGILRTTKGMPRSDQGILWNYEESLGNCPDIPEEAFGNPEEALQGDPPEF